MLKVAGGGGAAVGAVVYQGTWDASTNTPTLASGIGTKGNYYVVSVAGNTNLDGITDWVAGDWAIFNGLVWEKVDNTEAVISVNGQVGVVVLDAANVGAAANTVEIIAGTGLAGGGNLSANVTIDLANTAVTPATYGGGSNAAEVTVDAQGRITAAANVAIPQGTVTNVATGVGLTGGPITSTGTIDLANTAVAAGTYGDKVNVAVITVDAQGRLTNASNVAIDLSQAVRVVNIADATSITVNTDITDIAYQANTQAAGNLDINAPTGTPVNGQKFMIKLKSTNQQTFVFNAIFDGSNDLGLPSLSTGSDKYDYMGFIYNSVSSKWELIAKNFGF
jgi:hypothetical protein